MLLNAIFSFLITIGASKITAIRPVMATTFL